MAPTAQTKQGTVSGIEHDGIAVFKGIPFAKPPVGDLRWRAPQPPRSWDGVREATAFGNSAMQGAQQGGIGELIGIAHEATSEDCLYLNVWTPGIDDAKRPVMVWIHGGGNVVGSGSQPRIDGRHLARRGDVVVVTINYRMGFFGFLHLPEIGASGNEALLDQVAALRWVRENIASFGGDPGNVTVFGQSAGGFDIAQLLAMDAADGAFDKAIPMSGSLVPPVPADAASRTADALLERFGLSRGEAAKLRDVSAADILAAQLEMTGGAMGRGLRIGPVCDGEVIREEAGARIASGAWSSRVPVLVGTARDEYALFTAGNERLLNMDEAELVERLNGIAPGHGHALGTAYREVRAARGWDISPRQVFDAVMTEQMFRGPAIRLASLQSGHTPDVWMYLFAHESPAWGGTLRACHSLDIPFVFGTYEIDGMRDFCGEGDTIARLSEQVMGAWLAFAKTGNPNAEGLPEWPRYDTDRRATMVFGPDTRVEDDPMEAERVAWATIASATG